MTTDDVILTQHDAEVAAALLDELADAYADAYGVDPAEEKTVAFRRRISLLRRVRGRSCCRRSRFAGIGRARVSAVRCTMLCSLATGPDSDAQTAYEGWGWELTGRIPGEDGGYYSAYDLFVLPLSR
jgi:hypothetical protein